jgi:serine/threonine-protein kinase
MKQEDVEEYLKEYGYLLGNVKMVTDPADEGTVLAQDPERGTPLDKESKINIEVSDGKGTEKGTVPSVTGLSLEDAKKRIKEEGFRVGRVDYDWDNSIDKGYVIYQQYQANSLLDKGTSIDIQVSSGPEPAPVMPEETTPAEQPVEEQPAETPAG